MTGGISYLAAPYTHPDAAARQARFEAANRAAAILMRRGELVLSPLSHSHPIALCGGLPTGWEFWQNLDRACISACARMRVLCIDGWLTSTGIGAELEIATELGKPISLIDAHANPYCDARDAESLILEILHCEGNAARAARGPIFEVRP